MKTGISLLCLALLAAPAARAAGSEEATPASIKIEEPPVSGASSPDQLFTFAIGAFAPESVAISNGTYAFDYGSRPVAFQAQAGVAFKLFELGGSFYFQETLAFSAFSGNAVQSAGSGLTASSYTLGLLGLDTRLMYAGDWFPWKRLVPFVDAGYRYSVFYQPGDSGLESVEGVVGNPVAGAGLRFLLNPGASRAGDHPWFVQARIDRIFPAADSLNLASLSVFGGISLGL